MKFLIAGLGSMGKRRIRNLKFLKQNNIIGFDIREDRRKEVESMGIKTFDNFQKAMSKDPDAVIISTPPQHHSEYAKKSLEANKPFFTELNIINNGLDKVVKLAKEKNILAAASHDMRNLESIKKIKQIMDKKTIGNVSSFNYHVGQYLPDWHPWENFNEFFMSDKEVGGCREIIPGELTWLTWIFGKIYSLNCMKGKFSTLDINYEDTYNISLRFEHTLGNIIVDVISRIPERSLKIIGEKGTIIWDKKENQVKVYTTKDKKWKKYSEETGTIEKGYIHKEEPYIEEMKSFISALNNKTKYPYPLEEDLYNLKILELIEESSKEKKQISVKNGKK